MQKAAEVFDDVAEVLQNSEKTSESSPVASTSSSDTSLENSKSSEKDKKNCCKTKKHKYSSRNQKNYRKSEKCNQCDNKSSSDSLNEQIFPLYITSLPAEEEDGMTPAQITVEKLKQATKDILTGKFKWKCVSCGIIAIFENQCDAERVLRLDMAKIFGGPVQIAALNASENRFRRYVIIKDVPWCISKKELANALKVQGIEYGEIVRNKSQVKIEVLNACHVERLRQEGLSFYNCATFSPVILENAAEEHVNSEIIQCYKCQGFWHTANHCRNDIRCVRCGDNHSVECCPRPKNNPLCCNCGGNHHAAYKFCPVKLQLQNSVKVAFSFANKPNNGYFRS